MKLKYTQGKHPTKGIYKKGDSPIWKRLCKIKWEAESLIHWDLV